MTVISFPLVWSTLHLWLILITLLIGPCISKHCVIAFDTSHFWITNYILGIHILESFSPLCNYLLTFKIWPYSGKVFCRCKISRKCVQTLQKFLRYLFSRNKCVHSDHTPTSWWPHPTCEPKKQHWRTKQRSKLVKQVQSLISRGLRNCESIGTTAVVRNWLVGFSTADLDFDNFGASLTGSLVFVYIVAS